jgi:hypothetical protein
MVLVLQVLLQLCCLGLASAVVVAPQLLLQFCTLLLALPLLLQLCGLFRLLRLL